ncbi:hypothetical protein [Zhihengliuella halotolerans]|uniref:hypothetical protein n=1 Tax=Zhihengliuella halotolerans TaxID=370736 RepID=UPI003BF91310
MPRAWCVNGREGEKVAVSTVRRLMREAGLRGVSRRKGPRTTKPAPETSRPLDLVNREFLASRPDELQVADITYCARSRAGCISIALDAVASVGSKGDSL